MMQSWSKVSKEGGSWLVVFMAILGAVLLVVAARPASGASDSQLVSNFESYPNGAWAEGSTHSPWYVEYNGYGSVGVQQLLSTKVHYQRPMTSTYPYETHASMVVSNQTFNGVDLSLRHKTQKQLRRNSRPNPWEVGWTVWGHADDQHFYYFIFKPNGIELGKVHPDYPGAQRYLYTASSPKQSIGLWYTVRVRQVGATMDVWVNGNQVIKGFIDTPGPAGDEPYYSGKIGMYNEDCHCLFDNVRAVSTSTGLPNP